MPRTSHLGSYGHPPRKPRRVRLQPHPHPPHNAKEEGKMTEKKEEIPWKLRGMACAGVWGVFDVAGKMVSEKCFLAPRATFLRTVTFAKRNLEDVTA